ncbi:AI-2E family transporter [Primorskyibacter sp. S87]|uniref:AI-2E family transporter n=1 Tax=Primorskyibacter sp. S87 TaxID=3415126 RepID=UPI003C7A4BF9
MTGPEENPQPGRPAALRLTLSASRDIGIIIAVSVLGLSAGAGFLIPLVLAFLAYVLITAVSDRVLQMERMPITIPRWVADLIGVAVVLAGLFAVMFILASQATHLAREVGNYEVAFDSAVNRVVALIGTDVARFLRDTLVGIDMSLVARSAFGGATSFLSTFLLISLYVGFMMAERTLMGKKLKLAVRDTRLSHELSSIMAAVSHSLQSYVGVKTFVSTLTALVSYGIFRWLGLEFAETWAVLTFALNFIPSIGSIIAVIFPATVSLLQYDTITPFLIIVFLCGSVQFLMGNLLDPALLGRSLNLSTVMVMLALTFWSAVWGIIGAFLSVPLTVCIMIVFAQIPALRPVAILMSKDGKLGPAATENSNTSA